MSSDAGSPRATAKNNVHVVFRSGALTTGKSSDTRLPPGTVQALLHGERVSSATRRVLGARLLPRKISGSTFFSSEDMTLLRIICDDVSGTENQVDVAAGIDARLAAGHGDRWRDPASPVKGDAHRHGLRGIDEAAIAAFRRPYTALDARDRQAVLQSIADETAMGATRTAVSAFFAALNAEVAAAVYAHPGVLERIGYLGFADAAGWYALGPGEAELPEAEALTRRSAPRGPSA